MSSRGISYRFYVFAIKFSPFTSSESQRWRWCFRKCCSSLFWYTENFLPLKYRVREREKKGERGKAHKMLYGREINWREINILHYSIFILPTENQIETLSCPLRVTPLTYHAVPILFFEDINMIICSASLHGFTSTHKRNCCVDESLVRWNWIKLTKIFHQTEF